MPNEEFDIMKPISADLDIGTTMFDKPKNTAKPSGDDFFTSPVSSDLDIGTTMFDEPSQENTQDISLSTASEVEEEQLSDLFDSSTGTVGSTQEAIAEYVPTVISAQVVTGDTPDVSNTTNAPQVTQSVPLPVFSPPDPPVIASSEKEIVADLNYGFMTADEAALFNQANDNAPESIHIPDSPTPATDVSAVRPPEEVDTPENALERALEELQELQGEPAQQTTVSSDDQLMQMALEAEYLEEKQLAEEEWFPNSTVRVMGKVVRGKKKNIATLVMLIVFAFVFMLLPFILAYLL